MSAEYSEDQLVQQTTADFLAEELGWRSLMAWHEETLGPNGTLGRKNENEVVLTRELEAALRRLNPGLPDVAYDEAINKLTVTRATKSLFQTNREMTALIRDRVPVEFKDENGESRAERLRVIDFDQPENNDFLAVRELWVQGKYYRRRPDLIGFVNGLPLLFIELKAHYKDVQVAHDDNFSDYQDTIPHLFHHNALVMLSNGDEARVGTFSSPYDFFHEWKRLDEDETGVVDWETMLRGICEKQRFLDIVENFIHFDESPSGGPIKALAANHQYLGVNRAFEAVQERDVRAGKLGVFWHTQGSGKSYSMYWLAQKVHRKVAGSFTFIIVTDRDELDTQIVNTFVGCGAVAEAKAPIVHASSRADLKKLLAEDHRYIFTLIHKFDVNETEPCTLRDNVIVIADEAHRTQNGKLAEAMRLALPNAAFIAFTGTPLMEGPEDQLTRDTFGYYVSRYDFKRAVDDGATVKLFYDNRGEKLQLVSADINERMAEELEKHDLEPDQIQRLEQDLARDYHILTSDERLERVARDLVAHYASRWETGNAMLICLDKITCVRMYNLIEKFWLEETERQARRVQQLREDRSALPTKLANVTEDDRARLLAVADGHIERGEAKLVWLQETETCVVFSEDQNEVKHFKKWGLDILPHRQKLKERDLSAEYKNQAHPFRLAIVCAMWLTGFDVPQLSTLYIDKPMKGHNLMQAIARANRKAPGKNNGLIVDYNGMLKSLRAALAKYGDGPGPGGGAGESDTAPTVNLDELEQELQIAVVDCEAHLQDCGFDIQKLADAVGFAKLALLSKTNEDSAVNAVCQTDETRARFEVLAREVFKKRKALVAEPQRITPYRKRANAIEAIYKKLEDNKAAADISEVMMALHGIVGESITHAGATRMPGAKSGKVYDISHIDFDRLKSEFSKNSNKNTAVQSLKDAIDKRLQRMIAQNPLRTDFYKRYSAIIADYNRETDRVTIEETFEELVKLVGEMGKEEQRAMREDLDEENLAVFDVLIKQKDDLDTRTRNRVKEIARDLLDLIKSKLGELDHWKEKRQTQAQVKSLIYDYLYSEETGLPIDAYTEEDVQSLAEVVYLHVYRQYESADENVYASVANGGLGLAESSVSTVTSTHTQSSSIIAFPSGTSTSTTASNRQLNILPHARVDPFVNAVPLLDLKVAAGGFSTEQAVYAVDDFDWVTLDGQTQPAPGLFVAQVIGESMNRRIPNGAWCLWRANPGGTRRGKVVLAQLRDITDPEHGGRYTVKVYESEKVADEEGGWRHTVVRLKPQSDDAGFEVMVFEGGEAGELRVVAELVAVLG
ncbi:type I restriction endonuclease subunit R [Bradymonas sediminis]|uniref:type I restriction endonuclease subunit R n=1 Tax=Bradymonas sediminis TaxID=1548548 RepID=UPI00106093EC|nr:type I restriction endonuclease subunit R [Bradymonas sediminis]TDP63613.1 type I restriction enzyme R subunit [Bradymonas sediminis]